MHSANTFAECIILASFWVNSGHQDPESYMLDCLLDSVSSLSCNQGTTSKQWTFKWTGKLLTKKGMQQGECLLVTFGPHTPAGRQQWRDSVCIHVCMHCHDMHVPSL